MTAIPAAWQESIRNIRSCGEPNRLLIRTASNAYFPQLMSVISLPDRDETVKQAIDAAWEFLEEVEDLEQLKYERKKAKVKAALEAVGVKDLAAARITSVPWDQFGYSQVDNGLVNQLAHPDHAEPVLRQCFVDCRDARNAVDGLT